MEDIYTPKSWLDYAALLLEAAAEVDQRLPVGTGVLAQPPEKLAEVILQLDQTLSESIEAEIRHFSRNKTWLRLTPQETICVYLRLISAIHLAFLFAELSLNEHPIKIPTEPDCSEEEGIYEWFLITIWNARGRLELGAKTQSIVQLLKKDFPME